MLFNTLDFAIFLPIVFIFYWFVLKNNLKGQNILIVVASYIFYGWWDWRFLFLILLSTVIDYSVGLALNKTTEASKRKLLLTLSIISNLGILGFLNKYSQELDVVDLFNYQNNTQFYQSKYEFDIGHLNTAGSIFFSEKLAESIDEIIKGSPDN